MDKGVWLQPIKYYSEAVFGHFLCSIIRIVERYRDLVYALVMESRIKYLIIGGGVAGTTAAETIRSRDKSGSIMIVSDEPYPLYSRIMLSKPNFFLEKIPFDNIWLKKDRWYEEKQVSLFLNKSAASLNTNNKKITLDDGKEINYDKLLLAIGGCARRFSGPGADKKGVFVLRSLDDAKSIIAGTKTAKQAIAIGGGFVSFEMCEMLRLAGIDVTLLVREDYYWQNLLDEPSGLMIEEALAKGGVKILRKTEVAEVLGGDQAEGLLLKDGNKLECDMVVVGIGLLCPFAWIEQAGIVVNRGVIANEYLETNAKDVWVAGDAAEFNDLILEERVQLGNWVNAQMQGRAAGFNMAASLDELGIRKEPFRMVSFYTTQGFGITIAFVGDVRPEKDRLIIPRGSPEQGSYSRILIKDGEVVGATLINRTQELGVITKIIEKNIKTAGRENNFSDPSFNLAELLK